MDNKSLNAANEKILENRDSILVDLEKDLKKITLEVKKVVAENGGVSVLLFMAQIFDNELKKKNPETSGINLFALYGCSIMFRDLLKENGNEQT